MKLVFFADGCCRFDNWKSNRHGYLTIDQCFERCNKDVSCVALDVARPKGDKYSCHTFVGSLENLHTACRDKKDAARCYVRQKEKSKCTKNHCNKFAELSLESIKILIIIELLFVVKCARVSVLHTNHPSHGDDGKYFFFDADDFTKMVGETDWNGNEYEVIQRGSESWTG